MATSVICPTCSPGRPAAGDPSGRPVHLADRFTVGGTAPTLGLLGDGNEDHDQYHQHEPTDKHQEDNLLGQPTRARHRRRGGK